MKLKILTTVWLILIGIIGYQAEATTSNIVINEIQVAGETANDEFIELYNPTGSSVDISDWSIQYKSATGSSFSKKNFTPGSAISAGGLYVIAHADFTGATPDMSHKSIKMGSSGGNIYLVASHDKLALGYDPSLIVDKVAWGTGNDPETSATTKPTALSSLNRTVGVDSDDNASDFVIQISSPGQNNSDQGSESSEQKNENETSEPVNATNEEIVEEIQQETSQDENNFPTTGNIVINELIPNPTGVDSAGEWLELTSLDTQAIDLTGWVIKDKSRSYTLQTEDFSNLLINPGGYFVIDRSVSGIALNNTGVEVISLVNSTGQTVDEVTYEEPILQNESFARSNTGFVWTNTLTKGAENVITQEEKITEITENKKSQEQNESSNHSEPASSADGQAQDDTATDYSNLIINELIPNPEGEDSANEWIELYNKGDQSINLDGLKIGDSSSKIFEVTSGVIDPQGYYVIRRTDSGIALNNTGDEIKIWSPDGALINTARYYGSAVSGEAYGLSQSSGLWDWTTTPTPGKTNIFSQVLGIDTKGDQSSDTRKASSSFVRDIKPTFLSSSNTELAKLKSLKLGSSLTTEGVVSVLPGIFGKTYFYITDNRYGIRVYSAKSDFPDLAVGDLIEISGELSESNEELRIKISNVDDIKILESGQDIKPLEVELSEINESLEGSLIMISGDITSIKASNIYLDDRAAETRVYIAKGTQIDKSIYKINDQLQVTGIISQTKAGFRVMPRSQTDISLLQGKIAGVSDTVLVKDRSSNMGSSVYPILIGLTVLIVAFVFLNKRYKWLPKKKGDSFKPE